MNHCRPTDIELERHHKEIDVEFAPFIIDRGKIDTIKVNGIVQQIINKVVNIFVPTKITQIENDADLKNGTQVNAIVESKGYQTSSQVEEAITSKGYQTSSQVESAITSKGYDTISNVNTKIATAKSEVEAQIRTKTSEIENDSDYRNGTQVEQAILSKDYATNTSLNSVESRVDTLETEIDTKASESDLQALENRVENAETDIDTIESKIPSQASSSNQLADKSFVNSSIATQTAYFQGTFDVVSDLGLTLQATHLQVETALENIIGVKTNNDYVFVSYTDTTLSQVLKYERYKFTSDDNSWNYEYELNNSTFTAVQWEAINSGISALLVAQITSNQNAITQINLDLDALASRVGTNETNILSLQTSVSSLLSNAILGVKVAGTELTKDSSNKVNVPMIAEGRLGVAKIVNTFGIKTNANGELLIGKADTTNIDNRNDGDWHRNYLPIVPSNLDYAIEKGLGDNSLTWSDTEKTNARNTIGAENVANKKDTVNDSSTEYISGKALSQYIASGNGGYSKSPGSTYNFASSTILPTGFYHSNSWRNGPNAYGDVIAIRHSEQNKYGYYLYLSQSLDEMYYARFNNGNIGQWHKVVDETRLSIKEDKANLGNLAYQSTETSMITNWLSTDGNQIIYTQKTPTSVVSSSQAVATATITNNQVVASYVGVGHTTLTITFSDNSTKTVEIYTK